ncbi:MAG: DUF6932 family protein [Pseudomonadota bacterium]
MIRSFPSSWPPAQNFRQSLPPVPNFDDRGLLPPYIGDDGTTDDRSPYDTTMTEVVTIFGTTPARRRLLAGLLDYRALLRSLGYDVGIQFVDGSFVENVEAREGRDPGDIDVFSFLQRPDRYSQDAQAWATQGFPEWQTQIADQAENKRRFGLDTYAVAVDQCAIVDTITFTSYWYSLFSHKRVTHDWKGFLRIGLGATDDAAARALLVTSNA